jgi:DNA repair exonuclease SbcCD ATPase subunit
VAAITITEALQELKTLQKRIAAKREAIMPYVARPNQLKDPLEAKGGSLQHIKQERQAISDLEERYISVRDAIQTANHTTILSLGGKSQFISQWLTWKRDISSGQKLFLHQLSNGIKGLRQETVKKGNRLVDATVSTPGETDVVVHVDEKALLEEQDKLEQLIGDLDGKLSLLNATTVITIP